MKKGSRDRGTKTQDTETTNTVGGEGTTTTDTSGEWEARAPPPRTPAVSGALRTKGETGGQGENTRSS